MSRTNFDFSKHVHTTSIYTDEEGNTIQVDKFGIGEQLMHRIIFTNGFFGLVVTGDYGNWLFSRCFVPSAKSDLSCEHYWLEKLRMHSRQSIGNYSQEMTEEAINELIDTRLEDYGLDGTRLDECKAWFKELLRHTDNEIEYQYHAFFESNPPHIDSEMIPFHKEIDVRLKIVMDAFDEMCNRLKQA